jgi:hypothetical protein
VDAEAAIAYKMREEWLTIKRRRKKISRIFLKIETKSRRERKPYAEVLSALCDVRESVWIAAAIVEPAILQIPYGEAMSETDGATKRRKKNELRKTFITIHDE